MIRAQLRLLVRLWRLDPPPALLARVGGWIMGYLVREFAWQLALLCGLVIAGLLALGALDSGAGIAAVALVALALVAEVRFGIAAARSVRAVQRALEEVPGAPADSRFPRSHLVFPLLMLFPRGVRRRRGVIYHREGNLRLRLDVYSSKQFAERPRPAVVQVHGGGWIAGSRVEQGIPLLNHLASNGWVGFNIDYRLSPRATLPDHVIDVKRAIAWVRENAAELGVDPRRICITGGSAGGHLTALAALTANDPTLQPGFEDADTSVAAAVPFYGLYDLADEAGVYYPELVDWLFAKIVIKQDRARNPEAFARVSPTHRVHAEAPPFLVFHGDHDTLTPVADARAFVRKLREASRSEVLYVELPGAQHAFDLLPSMRTAAVIEGIERFLRTVVWEGGATAEGERAPPADGASDAAIASRA